MSILEFQHYPIDVAVLPKSWGVSSMSDLHAEVQSGFPTGEHNKEGRGIPHIRPMNIDRKGAIDLSEVKYVAPKTSGLRLQCGDVLFNNTNSPELIGKTTAITQSEDWAFSNHMTRLRFPAEVDFRFAAHQLHFLWMTRYFRHRCVNHVNQASISGKPLAESVPFILAPLNEQRRIVAKIDELFSDLDAGVVALERAKANLKRYRAAVLKAAVEGKLTETWRAEHPNAESASKLLERILIERRKRWEADQLAKFATAKKEPPKNWQEKYVEPSPPETADLPDLPKGWSWATVEQIAECVRYGSSAKTNDDPSGIPVVRMGNIVDGALDWTELKYLPKNHDEFPDLFLRAGDLLFNRTNSAELVGKSAIYDGQHDPSSYASYLISVRTIAGCESSFLCSYINSAHGRRWVKSVVSQQVGQANVNGTKLQALAFPLPPAEEQRQIQDEVAEALSQIDAALVETEHGLRRANRLRQSILKQAFEGKLVPQDPKDESENTLLERINEAADCSATSSIPKKQISRARRQKSASN